MTEERIQEIRARCEAATPGNWYFNGVNIMISAGLQYEYTNIAKTMKLADARFIAHARWDVPALLEALEETRYDAEMRIEAFRVVVRSLEKQHRACEAALRRELATLRARKRVTRSDDLENRPAGIKRMKVGIYKHLFIINKRVWRKDRAEGNWGKYLQREKEVRKA